jgi:uncharacterized membrane protein
VEKRPKLKLILSPSDLILEGISWFLVIALWFYVLTNYSGLSEIIPIHFDLKGNADGFGSKKNILGLPIVVTIIFIGLSLLNRFPHVFNYPVKITAENALKQYTAATRMIRQLKLIIVLVMGWFAYKSIAISKGTSEASGSGLETIIIFIIFLPLGIYFFKTLRK